MINAYSLTRRIYDMDLWWQPPAHRFRRWSSYDDAGNTENDCDHFLRISPDGRTATLVETPESGAIVRIWAAGRQVDRPVRMFQGGSDKPFLVAPLPSLFDGSFDNRSSLATGVDFNCAEWTHMPFVAPFIEQTRGASVCRVPIPFKNGLRVEVDTVRDPSAGLFYHVDCILTDKPDEVVPFDGRFSGRDFTLRHARLIHEDPLGFYGEELLGARRIQSEGRGDRVTLFKATGAGMVHRLVMRLSGVRHEDLHDIHLSIAYGGRAPSFDAPVSLLYDAAFELHAFRSRALGFVDGAFHFQLPVPFHDGVVVALESISGRAFGATCEATICDAAPAPDSMLLHSYSAFDAGPQPAKYVFADFDDARGRYVGMVFSCKPYQQEDNEIFEVDGAVVARGTGREDYFNMAWGFKEHCAPDYGCPVQSGEWPWQDLQHGHGYYSAYRLHFLESIPFQHGFRGHFEKDYDYHKLGHGWASTAFAYLDQPRAANRIAPEWRRWAMDVAHTRLG